MKQYVVDAFTEKVFSGNQAAICIMDSWLDDDLMMKITIENNLSETAFAVKENDKYKLRWFTPGGEIDLCGHATLAYAYVIMINVIEDPVCGSGHCHIALYWINKLNKDSVIAYQASRRGGTLYCSMDKDKVKLSGKAALFSVADINIK